jgi:hypothetical protein
MTTTKHRIRRDNAEFHKTTLKQNHGYASEQGKVWAHVAKMSHEMAAPTMTGAMNDVAVPLLYLPVPRFF